MISNVTNRLMPLIKEWQNRPLHGVYVHDILIISVDNLNGFSEAIGACYPSAEIQKYFKQPAHEPLALVHFFGSSIAICFMGGSIRFFQLHIEGPDYPV